MPVSEIQSMEAKLIRGIKDCFGNKIGEEVRFSLPPNYNTDDEPYEIIHRPKIPELDRFVDRYLQNNKNQ